MEEATHERTANKARGGGPVGGGRGGGGGVRDEGEGDWHSSISCHRMKA